jgi:DMSO/TMAO reductase YedYZ molybdopterin-dependent catalytic subunit
VTTNNKQSIPEAALSIATSKRISSPGDSFEVSSERFRSRTRRDVLIFGASALAALATGTMLLPDETLQRLGVHRKLHLPGKDWLLDKAIDIDDDVAEALYSSNRLVPTYSKSQVTGLKNNYNGATPAPDYISTWTLTLSGLQSGLTLSLDLRTLLKRFALHEQITRFICVEGWSEIAWWGGIRFADLIQAFPPVSQAKWARIESSVNLDANGNSDPYYISLDIESAAHPQSLLATHFHGDPLTVEHGAPLRLLIPVKLGLKNVKAVTGITYLADQPEDYWRVRGYSRYDGI